MVLCRLETVVLESWSVEGGLEFLGEVSTACCEWGIFGALPKQVLMYSKGKFQKFLVQDFLCYRAESV